MQSNTRLKVGFVGLGAMGLGMATQLVTSGHSVTGFDVAAAQMEKFVHSGGHKASSPRMAASSADIFVVVVANSAQADSVFFDDQSGAVQALQKSATTVLCATVPPTYHDVLQNRLYSLGRRDLHLLDAPISGGAVKAAAGQLTILVSGSPTAETAAKPVLDDMAEKVYPIPGGLGKASQVKMINQMLAGVHIVASAEAMALAAQLGLNTGDVFREVNKSMSWSWMFENRVEHMLRDDWTPQSALDIFVKDMGIVTSTARLSSLATPLSAIAEQLYISASANGMGRQDDAGIVRAYLPVNTPSLIKDSTSTEISGTDVSTHLQIVKDLLEGIHLVAAAEALALTSKIGLDVSATFEIIQNAAGTSRVFADRGKSMISCDFSAGMSLSVVSQKLTFAIEEARRIKAPVYLATAALQIYQRCAAAGLSEQGDSSLIAAWSLHAPKSMYLAQQRRSFKPREYPSVQLKAALCRLPPEYPTNVLPEIQQLLSGSGIPKLVVLDDDPTGTQTCHGIPVLTTWTVDILKEELSTSDNGFFILTNSRAFQPERAKVLMTEICTNLKEAASLVRIEYEVVLRGDSILRGHFPMEVEVAAASSGKPDGWILAPFFFQGGRYTIDDVHYVLEGTDLVPAGRTQFAEDRTFGYKSSNLRDYVQEKAGPERAGNLLSIGISDIRIGGPPKIAELLMGTQNETIVIFNAAAESDMHVFCAGVLQANEKGKKFLYRTGAAFVSSRLGIEPITPLTPVDVDAQYNSRINGGLIIAGSYVPKTTKQLDSLQNRRGERLSTILIDVRSLLADVQNAKFLSRESARVADQHLRAGQDVLLMSSRELITGADAASSLSIGSVVSQALVDIVQAITVRPRYVIAKGGITSSDAATKSLNIKKAQIIGQSTPGSPLWRCDEDTCRWPGIPFVVFPGNVGGDDTLGEIVERWSLPLPN